MQQTVDWLSQMGKDGTAATYRTALSSFMRFCDHREVPMETISSDLMLHYESWLRNQGICKNCSSAYMRSLRSVYNRAVDSGLIAQCHPFLHVYTGVDKTAKRAVSLETISSLKNLDLADRPALAFARDLFMFSFYTRGMAFVDMAFLKEKHTSATSETKSQAEQKGFYGFCLKNLWDIRHHDVGTITLDKRSSKKDSIAVRNPEGWLL